MSEMSEAEKSLDAIVERNRANLFAPEAPSGAPHGSRSSPRTGAQRSRLSTTFLGIGASIAVILRAIYGFIVVLPDLHLDPHPIVSMIAWAVLFVVILVVVATQLSAFRMPLWLFLSCLTLLALVLALDLWSIWELHNIGYYASAGLTAMMALLLFLTVRDLREIRLAIGVMALALIIAIGINTPLTSETLPAQIVAIGLAIVPVVIGIYVAGGFRAMVSSELERVLAQSTLESPRLSFGFLSSEELSRLDREAEQLLDNVAHGRMKLPLLPATATQAAIIATNLRFQLLEARRETWLHHAVSESPQLHRAVHLHDLSGYAGLLDPHQRRGLLAALWLLVSDRDSAHSLPTLSITVGPRTLPANTISRNMLVVPISLKTDGISRNQIDPSVWDSIRMVGRFKDSIQKDRLLIDIDIECVVENPTEK
jgi:hypothetical protein